MSTSLQQVLHNENFHLHLCATSFDRFVDWKITCLFYAALHLIKELAHTRKVNLGDKHESMINNLNPTNFNRKLLVKKDFYDSYSLLFSLSRSARYDGFLNYDAFIERQTPRYIRSQEIYNYLKKEVIRLGVII